MSIFLAVRRLVRYISPDWIKWKSLLFVLNLCLLLPNIVFFVMNNRVLFGSLWSPIEAYFLPTLDSHYDALLDKTLFAFVDALESANITFFIFSGTLLGSIRHHNRIPWDDDIDVIINSTDQLRVEEVLSKHDPKSFGLYTGTVSSSSDYTYQWKFFPKDGHSLFYKNHFFPYIDIFFFSENKTHIWNSSPYFRETEIWLKSHVFPLRRRPFGDYQLLAPCNTQEFLGRNFNISECQSRSYSHYFEMHFLNPITVPCERLFYMYPFVQRTAHFTNRSHRYFEEILTFRGATLKRFITQSC